MRVSARLENNTKRKYHKFSEVQIGDILNHVRGDKNYIVLYKLPDTLIVAWDDEFSGVGEISRDNYTYYYVVGQYEGTITLKVEK